MSRDYRTWKAVAEEASAPFMLIAQAFCPSVRLKPFDLWQNLRIYCRAATASIDAGEDCVDKIFLSLHYTWDIPTAKQIKQRNPWLSDLIIAARHKAFVRHEDKWGPGDVELAQLVLRRKRNARDRSSLKITDFEVSYICYRSGATPEGVISRFLKWEWDKLGRNMVRYSGHHPDFERIAGRLVLCTDSYHHSFFEAGAEGDRRKKWPRVMIPKVRYFDDALWQHFQVIAKNRGHMPWELKQA